jgi:hypothetical protein
MIRRISLVLATVLLAGLGAAAPAAASTNSAHALGGHIYCC